ncbi:MAG: hypothetical protein ACC628_21315 [Pirellulaceae bacterium]
MARRRSEQREAYWKGVLQRQRKSGQSVRAFCLANDISQGSFYNWRRKLDQPSMGLSKPADASGQHSDPMPFIPLKISGLAGLGGVIELLHPRGCVLRVPSAFDSESLLRLLKVLDQEGT